MYEVVAVQVCVGHLTRNTLPSRRPHRSPGSQADQRVRDIGRRLQTRRLRMLSGDCLNCLSMFSMLISRVILKFCQLQISIIFIVWTCLSARSDAVSGRYLQAV